MKLRARTKERIKGSITILLVVILIPMLTFSAIIVDISRINMAKAMVSSAGDLAMNSALANYDTVLKDVYGLFAMSQDKYAELDSEGKAQAMSEDIKDYFERTLVSYGVVEEENAEDYVSSLLGEFNDIIATGTTNIELETTNFLRLDDIDVSAAGVANSSLANADILRKQIVEYMKYRAPLEFGMGFLEALSAFATVEEQNKVIEKQVQAQEGAQDVTQACSQLMDLIRNYDDIVTLLNSALKGRDKSDDGIVVELKDYDTQVSKYAAAWGENYKHINRLVMVFLTNYPSTDGLYLASATGSFLSTGSGGTGIVKQNSGINENAMKQQVTLTSGNDEASLTRAKQNLDAQINAMSGTPAAKARAYVAQDFLALGYLNDSKTGFSNEASAMATYIAYEQYLKGTHGTVNYSDAKMVLEEMYQLKLLFDNYESVFKTVRLQALEQAKNTAYRNYSAAETARSTSAGNLGRYITALNNISWPSEGDVKSVFGSDFDDDDVKDVIKDVPALQGGTQTYNYYLQYYNDNLKDPQLNSKNKYRMYLETLSGSGTSTAARYALNYLDGSTSETFEEYVTKKSGITKSSKEYKVVKALYDACVQADGYYAELSTFQTCQSQYDTTKQEYNNAVTAYNQASRELEDNRQTYFNCLNGFKAFCDAYQADLKDYATYRTAAEKAAKAEADKISAQFTELYENVDSLATAITAVGAQIEIVKTAIKDYNDALDVWQKQIGTYEATAGSDSFSAQSSASVSQSKQEYDLESYTVLIEYVNKLETKITGFRDYLALATNFCYGSGANAVRIDAITDVSVLVSAVQSYSASLAQPVTAAAADSAFPSLYKPDGMNIPTFDPYVDEELQQLGFLEPTILDITILKYLNVAYPESTEKKVESKEETKITEAEYETQLDKLTTTGDESGGKTEDDATGGNKFGYTYKTVDTENKKLSGGTLPSAKKVSAKKVDTSEMNISRSTDDNKNTDINASSGMSAQKGKTSSALQGIGDALTAGVENTYILSYIFENFSHSAMIQEAMVEGVNSDSDRTNDAIYYTDVVSLMSNEEVIAKYKDSLTTLSNYSKNSRNNYIYGAEVEYILYGNANPSTNVTYARASIYAVRFAFNCIYAFTNTELCNLTMAAGMAVQAATLGIVPYQVVQIVLQLALAAAESAVDLKMMCDGMKVAIIKTTDTWTLSPSGMAGNMKDLATKAVTDVATNATQKAIEAGVGGIQAIIDAGADELQGAITGAVAQTEKAAQKVVDDFLDQLSAKIMSEIESGLSSLQLSRVDLTKTEVLRQVDTTFQGVENGLDNTLQELTGDNEMLKALVNGHRSTIDDMIAKAKDTVVSAVKSIPGEEDINEALTGKMLSIKQEVSETVKEHITTLLTSAGGYVSDAVEDVQDQLKNYAEQAGGELSEQAAEAIKENVTGLLDEFSTSTLSAPSTPASTGLASAITFGYSDYLMLFTYLAICVNDTGILLRTSDLIQLNIQSAGEGAEFSHKKGAEFSMSGAYTYVTVEATAGLDMFFMDLSLFQDVVTDDDSDTSGGNSSGETDEPTDDEDRPAWTTISYKGFLGY